MVILWTFFRTTYPRHHPRGRWRGKKK